MEYKFANGVPKVRTAKQISISMEICSETPKHKDDWKVNQEGCYVNGEKVSNVTIDRLNLPARSYIAVRVGNKPDSRYVGGFNLFGKTFGDYEQDIILTIEY